MQGIYSLIIDEYSRVLGCSASLDEIVENFDSGNWCHSALGALLIGHPLVIGFDKCFDCRLVAGYNSLRSVLLSSKLPERARSVLSSLSQRLRLYMYERAADYSSIGLGVAVVEEKRGYPAYFSFICSSGGEDCGLEKREEEDYSIILAWRGSLVLRQIVPRVVSKKVLELFLREHS